MFISEIFYSVQGEGQLIGVPSVFIRTSGCNLRCHWCDTPHTSWDPKGEEIDLDNIIAKVQQYPSKYVVITGGEPMLAKEIHLLAETLYHKNFHITIETAATIVPKNIRCHLASLSPKLKNSIPDKSNKWHELHQKNRYQPDILSSWVDHCEYQLKFVVSNITDFLEISEIIKQIAQISPHKIFIMPEGKDLSTLKKRCTWLIEECKKRGYRYAPRLHIELFGNVSGT